MNANVAKLILESYEDNKDASRAELKALLNKVRDMGEQLQVNLTASRDAFKAELERLYAVAFDIAAPSTEDVPFADAEETEAVYAEEEYKGYEIVIKRWVAGYYHVINGESQAQNSRDSVDDALDSAKEVIDELVEDEPSDTVSSESDLIDCLEYMGYEIRICRSEGDGGDIYQSSIPALNWVSSWSGYESVVQNCAENYIHEQDGENAYSVLLDGVTRGENLSLKVAERLANSYAEMNQDRDLQIYKDGELYRTVKESSNLVKQLKVYALRTDFSFDWISSRTITPDMVEGGQLYVNGCLLFDGQSLKIWAFPTPVEAFRFIVKSKRRSAVSHGAAFEEIWGSVGQTVIKEKVKRYALENASKFSEMYQTIARLNPRPKRQYKGFAIVA